MWIGCLINLYRDVYVHEASRGEEDILRDNNMANTQRTPPIVYRSDPSFDFHPRRERFRVYLTAIAPRGEGPSDDIDKVLGT